MLKRVLNIDIGNGLSLPIAGGFLLVFLLTISFLSASEWLRSADPTADPLVPNPGKVTADANGVALPSLDNRRDAGISDGKEAIRNPFADPDGLTGEVDPSDSRVAGLGAYDPKLVESFKPPVPADARPAPPQGGASSGVKISATRARWDARGYSARAQISYADSVLFDVSDLVPMGRVEGGSGPTEVIFRSISLERNVALPVGSKLHDGRLHSAGRDGVSFVFDDSGRGKITKPWGRGGPLVR